MTAPFIAEAERAAAEAVRAADGLDAPDREVWERMGIAAVAAVVPMLAEHFAQAVEPLHRGTHQCGGEWYTDDPHYQGTIARREPCPTARVIRESATPTEGGTT